MKVLACFTKTFKENIRDWKILILVIIFAPFFVYLMHMYFSYSGSELKVYDFEQYVPSMLVLSIIMMLFSAGASIVREIEKDTITRLRLSMLTSSEFMTAMTVNQIIIGMVCLFLTLLASHTVGYRTNGSLPLLLLAGSLTCFSVISISIITACFIRTMFGLLTLGCFPFFILMFFSDCFMPLPRINLITISGNQVFLNDILPTATATHVFDKILNHNSGFHEISFGITLIVIMSAVYFIAGLWLFRRKYRY